MIVREYRITVDFHKASRMILTRAVDKSCSFSTAVLTSTITILWTGSSCVKLARVSIKGVVVSFAKIIFVTIRSALDFVVLTQTVAIAIFVFCVDVVGYSTIPILP